MMNSNQQKKEVTDLMSLLDQDRTLEEVVEEVTHLEEVTITDLPLRGITMALLEVEIDTMIDPEDKEEVTLFRCEVGMIDEVEEEMTDDEMIEVEDGTRGGPTMIEVEVDLPEEVEGRGDMTTDQVGVTNLEDIKSSGLPFALSFSSRPWCSIVCVMIILSTLQPTPFCICFALLSKKIKPIFACFEFALPIGKKPSHSKLQPQAPSRRELFLCFRSCLRSRKFVACLATWLTKRSQ
jgi:hypothetical protein